MQQTSQFLAGERNYSLIRGDTGPLVCVSLFDSIPATSTYEKQSYPAGFLYVFSALNWITSGGSNIVLAQWIYADFAVATMAIVLTLYMLSTKVQWYCAAPLLLLSKRMHSIFVLRLFNDPVAMLPLYFSMYALTHAKTVWAAVLFSAALSMKMNILLFAPAFALAVLQTTRSIGASVRLACVAGLVQVGVAVPFVAAGYGHEYLARAFEFARVFEWRWTVNWRFAGPHVFADAWFARALMAAHLVVLSAFVVKWCGGVRGLVLTVKDAVAADYMKKKRKMKKSTPLDPDYIMLTMFTANLVGITFARSLHYQFYSWYFYSLPYLLFRTQLHVIVKLVLFFAIEYCWNVYPSTIASSAILFACHLVLLLALYVAPVGNARGVEKRKKK
ncbi:hypothetical protein HDU83_001718 [Entophlyctis luteolus]|nr:hypothetical protein HDU83_001718 [Entophlyctis luteolus]KAJ3394067.1 hypothetical protein HDU84_000095 [Entophlyctis sp. JEL0112]